MLGDKISQMQKVNDRTMKFPITLTAQFRQFPYKFYFNNNWMFRYWCYATVLSFPLFCWIQSKARSPANKELWRQKALKEAAEHHH